MPGSSDFRINSQVRSLLARHWIDLKKVQIGSFRGTVRLTGEVSRLGGEGSPSHDAQLLETLETEIRALPDVARVYIEATNWLRTASGQWVCTDVGSNSRGPTSSSVGDSVTLAVDTKSNASVPTPQTPAGRTGGGA